MQRNDPSKKSSGWGATLKNILWGIIGYGWLWTTKTEYKGSGQAQDHQGSTTEQLRDKYNIERKTPKKTKNKGKRENNNDISAQGFVEGTRQLYKEKQDEYERLPSIPSPVETVEGIKKLTRRGKKTAAAVKKVHEEGGTANVEFGTKRQKIRFQYSSNGEGKKENSEPSLLKRLFRFT